MLPNFTTLAHFSVSSAISLPKPQDLPHAEDSRAMAQIAPVMLDSLSPPAPSEAPAVTRVAKKLKLQERRTVIPSRRSLAACRPLHFFEAINGALCRSADK